MRQPVVVQVFNVVEDVQPQLLERVICAAIGAVFLEELEERLAAGIVKGVAFLGKRLDNIAGVQQLPKGKSRVFGASVRMKDKAVRNIAAIVCLLEGFPGKFHIMLARYAPANDLPGEQIHDNAKIVPYAVGLDVCEVAGPDEVGRGLVELLLKMVP